MPYRDLVRQPLLLNPMLDASPRPRRATPAEETELLRWARHGVTRVSHVLDAPGRRVLAFAAFAARYPALVGRGATRDAVQKMYRGITANLHRWQHTLGAGPAEHVQKGELRGGRKLSFSTPGKAAPEVLPAKEQKAAGVAMVAIQGKIHTALKTLPKTLRWDGNLDTLEIAYTQFST